MREFLQKFVDWIAMLLRWLYAAPNDAVQCQHDTRVEKLRDVSVRHVGRGLNSSELVKGRMLLAECKSFIRQRLKRMTVGVVLLGTTLSVSGQALNLDFHNGLEGWELYYGVSYHGSLDNSGKSYYWSYYDLLNYIVNTNTDKYAIAKSLYSNNNTYFGGPSKYASLVNGYTASTTSSRLADYRTKLTYEPTNNARMNLTYSADGGTYNYVNRDPNGERPGCDAVLADMFSGTEHDGSQRSENYVTGSGTIKWLDSDKWKYNYISTASCNEIPTSGVEDLARFCVYADAEDTHPTDPYFNVKNWNYGSSTASYPVRRVHPDKQYSCRLGTAAPYGVSYKTKKNINDNSFSAEFSALRQGLTGTFNGENYGKGYLPSGFASAERMAYEFQKTDETDVLIVYYLAMAANPVSHAHNSAPFFEIKCYYQKSGETTWNEVACGASAKTVYDMKDPNGGSGSSAYILSTAGKNWNNANADYGWSSVAFPITVKDATYRLEVTTGDCTWEGTSGSRNNAGAGGHPGWIYFSAETMPRSLDIKYCDSQRGPFTATATKGYTYYRFGVKAKGSNTITPITGIVRSNELTLTSTDANFMKLGVEGTLVCEMGMSELQFGSTMTSVGSTCLQAVSADYGATAIGLGIDTLYSCAGTGLSIIGVNTMYTQNSWAVDPITLVTFDSKKNGTNTWTSRGSVTAFVHYDEATLPSGTKTPERISFSNSYELIPAEEFTTSYTIRTTVTTKSGCTITKEETFAPSEPLNPSFGIAGLCQYGPLKITSPSQNPKFTDPF
ncbi:MAG: hypothetical protein IJ263_09775, partial [Paludibacteraceae bacterium]|nr:hypothetical protein [Paludibacteraceae bacterium]